MLFAYCTYEQNYRSWDLTNGGDRTKVKILIKFETFQSNSISAENVRQTNFTIISGYVVNIMHDVHLTCNLNVVSTSVQPWIVKTIFNYLWFNFELCLIRFTT